MPPDEHPWIEQFGCTATYRALRDGIRDVLPRALPAHRRRRGRSPHLNPGAAASRRLVPRAAGRARGPRGDARAAPPPVDAAARAPRRCGVRPTATASAAVTLRGAGGRRVVTADCSSTRPRRATCSARRRRARDRRRVKAMTGEPHAPGARPAANQQPFTVCFAVDHPPARTTRSSGPRATTSSADAPQPGSRPTRAQPARRATARRPTRTRTRWRSGPTSTPPAPSRTSGASAGSPRAGVRARRLRERHHAGELAAERLLARRGPVLDGRRGAAAQLSLSLPVLDADRGPARRRYGCGLRLRGDVVGDTATASRSTRTSARSRRSCAAASPCVEQDIAAGRAAPARVPGHRRHRQLPHRPASLDRRRQLHRRRARSRSRSRSAR